MSTDNDNKILLDVAVRHGVSDARPLRDHEVAALPFIHGTVVQAVGGEVEIEGAQISVTIGLTQQLPCALPLVFISPWDKFGVIPHVGDDGYVCAAHHEGLIVDPERPEDVVSETVGRALQQVRQGARRENWGDFSDEFQTYWNRQNGISHIRSFVTPTCDARLVDAYMNRAEYSHVCDRQEDVVDYLCGGTTALLTKRNALYVPLRPGTVLVPPHPDRGWSAEQATRTILSSVDTSCRTRASRLSHKLSKQDALVICHLPRSDGEGGTLFALKYMGNGKVRPLAEGQSTVKAVALHRRDRGFIVPRGGGRELLTGKSAALVGCGSIGGFLALQLARTGIQRFTLVDPDCMSDENTYRHVLGRKCVGEKKVVGLKKHMEETIPYLRVDTVDTRVEDALASGALDPSRFDVIVVALGHPPTELYLNRAAEADAVRFPPLVFAWVEALGLGTHVLVCNNRTSGTAADGCLECLYTTMPGDTDGLHCRASFAQAGQNFGRNISGCSGLFTPYGSTVAVRAALTATEATIDLLEGRENGNPLISVKGRADEFIQAGFCLTSRYSIPDDDLNAQRYGYCNPDCSVCRGRT